MKFDRKAHCKKIAKDRQKKLKEKLGPIEYSKRMSSVRSNTAPKCPACGRKIIHKNRA